MSHGGPVPVVPQNVTRSPAFTDVYSNQLRMGATISDVSITFGVSDDRGVGVVGISDQAAIHLAPVTAKMLMLNLQAVVAAYEKSVMKIPISAAFIKHIEGVESHLAKNLTNQMTG